MLYQKFTEYELVYRNIGYLFQIETFLNTQIKCNILNMFLESIYVNFKIYVRNPFPNLVLTKAKVLINFLTLKANLHQIVDPDNQVLIEGVLFRARYLGSTQLVNDGNPTKLTRMLQAQEAVGRIKVSFFKNFNLKSLK